MIEYPIDGALHDRISAVLEGVTSTAQFALDEFAKLSEKRPHDAELLAMTEAVGEAILFKITAAVTVLHMDLNSMAHTAAFANMQLTAALLRRPE